MNFKKIAAAVAGAAPGLATALGGPLAGQAVRAVSRALLGREDATELELDAITASMSPDALLQLRRADNEFKAEMGRQGIQIVQIDAEVVKTVNETMRVEASAEHWPTYSWRPFIGFSFGLYVCSMFMLPLFGVQPAEMSAELVLAVGGILGVASWFRGRMQADPTIPTVNRG